MRRTLRPFAASARWAAVAFLAGLLTAATPASAGDRFELGLRFGGFEPSNSQDTYDAIYGGTMPQLGVQFEVHTARRIFFQAAFDHGSVDGGLVFPVDGGFEPTGTDSTLTLTPLHLTAAWLFRRPGAAWNAYAGLGPSVLFWSEKSDFDERSSSDFGGSAVVGLRKPFTSWSLGAEIRWSTFPGALGDEGLADLLDEGDLGGFGLNAFALYRF